MCDSSWQGKLKERIARLTRRRTLGAQVRVLSVQRVNRSFNARNSCLGRTYHYYLPATILRLRMDGAHPSRQRQP